MKIRTSHILVATKEEIKKPICLITYNEIETQEESTLEEQITSNIEKAKIQKQIDALKKKMKNEKQFNRQIEIKTEIKKLEELIK